MKQIEKNEQAEQELNVWCNTLYNYTKQMAENPTRANKWIFDKASHDEWILSKFPKHLSSVKAYNLFGEFVQWIGIKNCKPIFCETDNRYI